MASIGMYGSSLIKDILPVQRKVNEAMSKRLEHAIAHPLKGTRRYRRGKNRCKECGGLLHGGSHG